MAVEADVTVVALVSGAAILTAEWLTFKGHAAQ
jgi:hypothetical protein